MFKMSRKIALPVVAAVALGWAVLPAAAQDEEEGEAEPIDLIYWEADGCPLAVGFPAAPNAQGMKASYEGNGVSAMATCSQTGEDVPGLDEAVASMTGAMDGEYEIVAFRYDVGLGLVGILVASGEQDSEVFTHMDRHYFDGYVLEVRVEEDITVEGSFDYADAIMSSVSLVEDETDGEE